MPSLRGGTQETRDRVARPIINCSFAAFLYIQLMNTPTLATPPSDEHAEVIQALKVGEMTTLISLDSVDEAMTYLKKRYLVE